MISVLQKFILMILFIIDKPLLDIKST